MATLTFELPTDHPGFSDAAYRERRAAISEVGRAYQPGEPIPDVTYTEEEDEVWRIVSAELATKHRAVACAEYLASSACLVLPADRVPQLSEVDERVRALTGFRIRPVAGLVPARDFYAALAERTFLSTQYIRHHSVPFYTPEPDVLHEIVGHANMLASPKFADLYEKAGWASLRSRTSEALDFFSKVFWFTLEFGVVRESEEVNAYGAGLLSSFGELDAFRDAEIRRWDVAAMGTLEYDITHYQPILFEAPSFDRLVHDLGGFFDDFRDAWYAEHVQGDPR
ncbi:MAG TPA: phenylalanine 4-monooxygenase [Acidimicrobiales bacterium]|nr:phenylalanine 4-monooxygenase [Acidimicrobiales bacterium]